VVTSEPTNRRGYGLYVVVVLSLPSYLFVAGDLLIGRLGDGPDNVGLYALLGIAGLLVGVAAPFLWAASCVVAVWSTIREKVGFVRKVVMWAFLALSALANLQITQVFRRF